VGSNDSRPSHGGEFVDGYAGSVASSGHAAVDHDLGPGNETRLVRRKEKHGICSIPAVAHEPSGMRRCLLLSSASTSPPARCLARRASTIGVCNWPGITVLTRMPFGAYCTATTRENCMMPALVAAYQPVPHLSSAVRGRRNVDDCPTTLLFHYGKNVFTSKENALEIVIHLSVPDLSGISTARRPRNRRRCSPGHRFVSTHQYRLAPRKEPMSNRSHRTDG